MDIVVGLKLFFLIRHRIRIKFLTEIWIRTILKKVTAPISYPTLTVITFTIPAKKH
jgi:hypothetical protein